MSVDPTYILHYRREHAEGLSITGPGGVEYCPAAEIEALAARGSFYTGMAPEGVVCVAGVTRLWSGVGYCYVAPTSLVRKYPIAYSRKLRAVMLELARVNRLHRLQCEVHAGWPEARRWCERVLGMRAEGVLRRYGPDGADYIMYSRVFDRGGE